MSTHRHSGEGRNPVKRVMLVALIASATPLTGAHAAELGRLFYTPQQRAQLDTQQASGESVDGVKRNYLIVNGVIQKQGGNRIVWINGSNSRPAMATKEPLPPSPSPCRANPNPCSSRSDSG